MQGCAHTLYWSEREREREIKKERGRERKREGERKREKESERKKEGERERCRICPELLFLFLKGMMGALAPFSYIVQLRKVIRLKHEDC